MAIVRVVCVWISTLCTVGHDVVAFALEALFAQYLGISLKKTRMRVIQVLCPRRDLRCRLLLNEMHQSQHALQLTSQLFDQPPVSFFITRQW